MSYEIGDRFFIIGNQLLNYNYKKNMEFVIKSFSKSGLSVYYEDNCILKCIGISNIELVSTRKQRERNIKLRSLGI